METVHFSDSVNEYCEIFSEYFYIQEEHFLISPLISSDIWDVSN